MIHSLRTHSAHDPHQCVVEPLRNVLDGELEDNARLAMSSPYIRKLSLGPLRTFDTFSSGSNQPVEWRRLRKTTASTEHPDDT